MRVRTSRTGVVLGGRAAGQEGDGSFRLAARANRARSVACRRLGGRAENVPREELIESRRSATVVSVVDDECPRAYVRDVPDELGDDAARRVHLLDRGAARPHVVAAVFEPLDVRRRLRRGVAVLRRSGDVEGIVQAPRAGCPRCRRRRRIRRCRRPPEAATRSRSRAPAGRRPQSPDRPGRSIAHPSPARRCTDRSRTTPTSRSSPTTTAWPRARVRSQDKRSAGPRHRLRRRPGPRTGTLARDRRPRRSPRRAPARPRGRTTRTSSPCSFITVASMATVDAEGASAFCA